MKTLSFLLVFFLLAGISYSQIAPTSCDAPDSIKLRYEFDAKVLAVQSMQGTSLEDSAIIPQALIEGKMKLLLAVYNAIGLAARDTVVDCLNIHLDSLEHSLRHVWVSADTGLVWFKNLAAGFIPSGNSMADSLLQLFGMSVLQTGTWSNYREIWLVTDQEYNTAAIAKKFLTLDGVIDAHNNYAFCWGCDQIIQEFPVIDTFVILKFLHCWGDNCGYKRMWEFHLPIGCEVVHFAGSYWDLLDAGVCDNLNAVSSPGFFKNFEVFPSPADDFCFVKINPVSNFQGQLSLVNLSGQQLRVQEIRLMSGQENQLTFETGSLPQGLYFLVLKTDNQIFTKKIIIHHH